MQWCDYSWQAARFGFACTKLVTAVQGVTAGSHYLAAGCQRLVARPMVTDEVCQPGPQNLWQLLDNLQQLSGKCS